MSTDLDTLEKDVESVLQHFLRGAGETGAIDDGRHRAEEQARRQQGIYVAEDALADALDYQRADHVLESMPLVLNLLLAFGFQPL